MELSYLKGRFFLEGISNLTFNITSQIKFRNQVGIKLRSNRSGCHPAHKCWVQPDCLATAKQQHCLTALLAGAPDRLPTGLWPKTFEQLAEKGLQNAELSQPNWDVWSP